MPSPGVATPCGLCFLIGPSPVDVVVVYTRGRHSLCSGICGIGDVGLFTRGRHSLGCSDGCGPYSACIGQAMMYLECGTGWLGFSRGVSEILQSARAHHSFSIMVPTVAKLLRYCGAL